MKICVISLLMVLSGCNHTSVYEVVARELVAAEVVNGVGYAGTWRPLGVEVRADLTLAQRDAFRGVMRACIDELSSQAHEFIGREGEPSSSIATAQLLLCMRAKGWELRIEEFVSA